MILTGQELTVFYETLYGLIWYINEKHKIIPHFDKPGYSTPITVDIKELAKIRNAMWDNPHWIKAFLVDCDNGEFTEQKRGIIAEWCKHFIRGKFLVMKHLAKYSVLMTFEGEPTVLYAVCGTITPMKYLFQNPVPFVVELVLLPFAGKIIYDSFAVPYNVSFGASMRSGFKESYNEIRTKYGVIEVLNGELPTLQLPSKKPDKKATKPPLPIETIVLPKGVNVPKSMMAKYNETAAIIICFCDEKLNEEYKEITLRALAKLCRKRPSPIESGRARTWACGIVYAIGSNNFIFDKSQPINMTATDIAEWFGLSKSTASGKAAEVLNILKLTYTNIEFSLKSLTAKNPAIWYLNINGFIVDIRIMPRDLQEEAFRKGLIPYIPDDEE